MSAYRSRPHQGFIDFFSVSIFLGYIFSCFLACTMITIWFISPFDGIRPSRLWNLPPSWKQVSPSSLLSLCGASVWYLSFFIVLPDCLHPFPLYIPACKIRFTIGDLIPCFSFFISQGGFLIVKKQTKKGQAKNLKNFSISS